MEGALIAENLAALFLRIQSTIWLGGGNKGKV
jgi:hypothetical protein